MMEMGLFTSKMDISRIVYTTEIFQPELIGTTINHLHIFKYVGYIPFGNPHPKHHFYLCKCECGNEICLSLSGIKKKVGGCGCKNKKRADLFYKKFGRLTVIDYAGYTDSHYWMCYCECGNITKVLESSLIYNKTNSCSCLHKDRCSTHRDTKSPEFGAFCKIKDRCNNPRCVMYKWYGAKGIKCKFDTYEEFLAEIGRRPSNKHSIDRIDNSKGYEPGNLRWATMEEQNNNKSTTVYLEYNNKRLPISRWAKILQVEYNTFRTQYRAIKDDAKTIEYYLKKKGLDYASLQG